jgi:hypothetical protein
VGQQSQIKRTRRLARKRGESTEKPAKWRAANEKAAPYLLARAMKLRRAQLPVEPVRQPLPDEVAAEQVEGAEVAL